MKNVGFMSLYRVYKKQADQKHFLMFIPGIKIFSYKHIIQTMLTL